MVDLKAPSVPAEVFVVVVDNDALGSAASIVEECPRNGMMLCFVPWTAAKILYKCLRLVLLSVQCMGLQDRVEVGARAMRFLLDIVSGFGFLAAAAKFRYMAYR
jgi:hypothetical protein